MPPNLPLPRGWKRRVRSSVLNILALSHYTFTALLAKAALLSPVRDKSMRFCLVLLMGLAQRSFRCAK